MEVLLERGQVLVVEVLLREGGHLLLRPRAHALRIPEVTPQDAVLQVLRRAHREVEIRPHRRRPFAVERVTGQAEAQEDTVPPSNGTVGRDAGSGIQAQERRAGRRRHADPLDLIRPLLGDDVIGARIGPDQEEGPRTHLRLVVNGWPRVLQILDGQERA